MAFPASPLSIDRKGKSLLRSGLGFLAATGVLSSLLGQEQGKRQVQEPDNKEQRTRVPLEEERRKKDLSDIFAFGSL